MFKGNTTFIILGVIIVAALILRVFSLGGNWVCVDGSWVKHGNPFSAQPTSYCAGTKIEIETPAAVINVVTTTPEIIQNPSQILIDNPQPGAIVTSPLIVKGQARGNWFFEASLPVKLLDENGQTIASSPARAEGEWMTNELVPFSSQLDFTTTSTSGYLLITKDNPSGLPENDASIRISVRFK